MNRLPRAGLGVLTSLLLVATAGTVTSAGAVAASTPAHAITDGRTDKPADKGERRYLYRASFTATVTNDLKLVYPGPNNDDIRHMSASIAGSHPALEVSTADRWSLIPRSTKSRAAVTSAELSATNRTDDGAFVDTCKGDSAVAKGPASPTPHPLGGSYFIPFTELYFSASCTDTLGHTSTAKYFLPPEETDVSAPTGRPGDAVMTYSFESAAGTPPLQVPAACPGYEEGPDNTCAYTISGTLTLKLIKELKPLKDSGKGASVSKGAKKATVMVQCPMACRIEVEVMPLRGSPRVLTRENMSLPPKKSTTVSLPIPAKNRAPAVKSGGVRIEITYRVPGVPAFTQTREARL